MSQKRQPGDGGEGSGEGSPDEKRPRISSFQRVVMEAVKMHNVQKFLMAVEPLIRKVVKEEVELALSKHLACMNSHCGKQIYPPMSRSLQLQFINKLSLPIFTGTKIEGEDCSAISIALVDGLTGAVVTSGPESLMKVEIVVLEGDFEVEEENDWTVEEFKNNIVREREGKRLLLTGDVFLELNEGIGSVGDLSFTDNSSWTRSRKFRLGARVVDGYFNGMRVREAKTEAFMVKDHRGELYKKHYPPSLSDEVWRLEKIGKDGAFHKRLCSENIHTVKDFLTLLCTDALRLRNILGSGMSAKMWEITVEHARTCMINNQMYVYCPDGQGKPGVVFNIVGEVMGILSQQQYISVNELSDSERADARALVKAAFEHWEDVMACDMGVITNDPSHAVSSSLPFGSQLLPDNLYSSFSHKANTFGFLQPGYSSLDVVPIGCTRSMDTYTLQAVDGMETRFEPESHVLLSCDAFKDSQELQRISNPIVFDECGSQACFSEDSLQYPDSNVSLLSQNLVADSPADLGTAVNSFLRSPVARKRAGWRTLICVLKWKFSIRRIVASKKNSCKTRRYR